MKLQIIARIHLARPSDQKIEVLQQKYEVSTKIVEEAIQTDPTENVYVEWILKSWKKNLIVLPEDSNKIKSQLSQFNKLKNSPNFTGNKDINAYTPSSLYAILEEKSKEISQNEKDRQIIQSGSEIIYNEKDLKIYKVLSIPALMLLGSNTNWCTVHEKDAEKYLKKPGDIYIGYYQNKPYVQIRPKSPFQLMDRKDQAFHSDNILAKDPILIKFIEIIKQQNKRLKKLQELREPTKELEETLLKEGNISKLVKYAKDIIKGRWLEAEPYIIKNPTWACQYAKDIIKGRWPEAEPYIMKDPEGTYHYAKDIIKGRWLEAEPYIMGNPYYAYHYAKDIIKGPWLEAEPYIMKDPIWAYYYNFNFKSKN
jgi:hypothetical protein